MPRKEGWDIGAALEHAAALPLELRSGDRRVDCVVDLELLETNPRAHSTPLNPCDRERARI